VVENNDRDSVSARNSVSSKKLKANRRNAQKSTGPTSEEGKKRSRRNALKHGVLASSPVITAAGGGEDAAAFKEFVYALVRDGAPVGTLEEMMVEKIALCWLRQMRSARFDAVMSQRAFEEENYRYLSEAVKLASESTIGRAQAREKILAKLPAEIGGFVDMVLPANPPKLKINDGFTLPADQDLNRLLRYETSNQRQLAYAINQLERLQRARKGEHVPAPVAVHLSSDQ
jgi:hypothetical protein